MVLIVSIFSACVLTILATFFAVLNQKAIGDGALYSLQSATIFTDMAARCGWAMHSVPKVNKKFEKILKTGNSKFKTVGSKNVSCN